MGRKSSCSKTEGSKSWTKQDSCTNKPQRKIKGSRQNLAGGRRGERERRRRRRMGPGGERPTERRTEATLDS